MAYVFGDTFICSDAETAKSVTFSREVGGVKSVTLEGDVYDPSGTLSGGSVPSSSGILVKVQELMNIERKLVEAQGKLKTLEQEEQRSREARDKWKSFIHELEIEEHGMKLLEEQVGGSNASRVSLVFFFSDRIYEFVQVGAEIETLKKTISNLQASLQASKDKQRVAKDEIKKLEKDMDEFKNNKDGKIDELKVCPML
jgi:structural maintenance of chromosome 2